jgi:predicted Zn finger-like uncharacterized protein
MILTCPECASRYVVDDARVPPQGRTVRCANCGRSWRAMPVAEAPLELETAPDPEPVADEAPVRAGAGALPKKIRAKTAERNRTRQAVAAGAVWGALGAVLLAVVAGAALFRVDVVRLWPRTAGAYAKVGLPVNPTGLAPENVQAAPGLKDGHAAVIVSGLIRNVETRAHEPVPLRVALLDKHGKTLVAQLTSVAPGPLQPGQTRPFTIAFLDPPSASADVQVEFALNAPKPAHGAGHGAEAAHVAADEHAPKLRGRAEPELPALPVAKVAEELPADSPYALPNAAHEQDKPDAGHHG